MGGGWDDVSLEKMDPPQEGYNDEQEYDEDAREGADDYIFPSENMLAVTSLFSLYGSCFRVVHARLA